MSVGAPQSPQGRQAAAYITWQDATGGVSQLVFDVVESEDWQDDATVTEHPVEDGPNIADNVRDELSKCTLKVFASNEPIGSSQWANASMVPTPLALPKLPPVTVEGDGTLQVPEWQSNLEARILATSGAGLVGSAVGGQVGGIVAGAVVGAAAGALLQGKVVYETLRPQLAAWTRTDPAFVTPTILTFDQTGDFVAKTIQQLLTLKKTKQLLTVLGTKQFVDNMVIDGLATHRDEGTGTGASISIHFTEVRIASTSTVPAPAPSLPRATTPVSGGNQNTTDEAPPKESAWHALIN